MTGEGGHAIIGGDWPNTLPTVTVHSKPRPLPTGLDWSKHRAPDPEPVGGVDDGKTGPEQMPATRAQTNTQHTAATEEARDRLDRLQSRPVTPEPELASSPAKASGGSVDAAKKLPTIDVGGCVIRAERSFTSREVEFTELVRDTADHTSREVVSARFLALAALEHLRLVAASTPTVEATPEPPRPPVKRATPVRHDAPIDVDEIVRRYKAGESIKTIAQDTHRRKDTIRRTLQDAGVHVLGRGGGHTLDLTAPETGARARALYLDDGMTIEECADRMDMSAPTFSKLMRIHDIRVRTGGSPVDRMVGYRGRLAALGVTSSDVRAWWDASGRPPLAKGPAPSYAIDAYEEAHR